MVTLPLLFPIVPIDTLIVPDDHFVAPTPVGGTVTADAVLESIDGRKVPSRANVIRVRLGSFEGLPKRVGYVLLSVTATGGEENSSVVIGRCGVRRTRFMTVTAGQQSTQEGWVRLRGGDLCVSASKPTPVVVNVLGVG